MDAVRPIDTVALFAELHGHLMSLLRGLSDEDWHRPTVCKGWSVKDIVAHMADVDLRMLAIYRDNYAFTDAPVIDSYQSLVGYLNKLNNDWVTAAKRLSPAILTGWLAETGPQLYDIFKQLSPFENAVFSVAWAGEEASPNWFHVARQYTEVWHHQQQIRLAVGHTTPLLTTKLYYPLLDTFVRAMPYTYRHIEAGEGKIIKLTITGVDNGNWYLVRVANGWQLFKNANHTKPDAAITIDGEIAWRLFTRGIPRKDALPYINIEGDKALGEPVIGMLSVMT